MHFWIFEVSSCCYSVMCWHNSIHPGFGPGSIEESITTWTLAVWWMLSWHPMIDLSCADISRNTIDRVYFSFWLQQNTHFLCIVDTCRLWGKAVRMTNRVGFVLEYIKLLLSLPPVYWLGNPLISSLVHCSVPFGSFFLLSYILLPWMEVSAQAQWLASRVAYCLLFESSLVKFSIHQLWRHCGY